MLIDITAGNRAMWKNKHENGVVFIDKRRNVKPKPDVVAVWAALPFKDGAFDGGVFDPPQMLYKSKGKPMGFNFEERYGILNRETWEADLSGAVRELLRVIIPGGRILFKWNDNHVSVKRLLACLPVQPVSAASLAASRGVRRPGSTEPRSKTWYLQFQK